MKKHVTIVFQCDITQFYGNPFHAETCFGSPVGITNGDLQESCAITEELGESLRELVAAIDNDAPTLKLGPVMRRARKALEDYEVAE
jgi:hypothetical protein